MTLDKSIEHGKEKRTPYRNSKRVDPSCRNHGDCPWCTGNRINKNREKKRVAEEKIQELINNQKDIEGEYVDFVNNNFWDLLEE